MPKQPSRLTRYRRLVRLRKADQSLSKYGFTNPADTRFDGKHLGSYAHWAGDLDAEVMVVFPDFRCADKFIADRGLPILTANPADTPNRWKPSCNAFLLQLLRAGGWDIGLPHAPQSAGVFLADAVPFYGLKNTYTRAKKKAYRHCAAQYVIPLIELIAPRVVIAVGVGVTNALFYHLQPTSSTPLPREAAQSHLCRMLSAPHYTGIGNTVLFPVLHPGYTGQQMRCRTSAAAGFEAMLADWQRISHWLKTERARCFIHRPT